MESNKPLISIILPTYNGSKYIANAINSVLAQSYTVFELIIINDASTDSVESIILKYKKNDNRIIYVKNDINLERSKSKNKWVKISKWKYITFLDDDDIWINKDKLKKQVDFLEKNTVYWIIWTNASCIDEYNNKIWEIIVKLDDDDIRSNILITNQFLQSSIMIKKDIFEKVWWFNEKMNLCEDYDLWLRILSVTKGCNLDIFGINYLIRKNSTTSKNLIKMKYTSLKLILKYKSKYPNFFIAILWKILTFFLPISSILKIISKIKNKV